LTSCSNSNSISSTENIEPLTILNKDNLGFEDGRSRFRDIFCTIFNNNSLSKETSCEELLLFIDNEKAHSLDSVVLKPSEKNFIVGLVPGIAWQCVRNWLDNDNSGPQHAQKHGYDVRLFTVDGLSGTVNNAGQIRNHVNALSANDSKRPIILIGYSKGAADVLYAISQFPELSQRVVAVVSVAGAVGGSPLAENTSQSLLNMLAYIPQSGCETGDDKALESLHTETRQTWLENNTLPDNIHYYSVIAYPEQDKISFGLQPSYSQLEKVDSRNDGQLIFYDQLIPDSTLLAFVNADHWAMSVPVARQHYLNRITFANENDYPREILLEAILRYIEEDL